MAKSIIIGTDVSVWEVVSTLRNSSIYSQVTTKLSKIAYELGASSDFVKTTKDRVFWNQLNNTEALINVLEDWVSRKADEATLECLLSALTKNNLSRSVELLKNAFPHDMTGSEKVFKGLSQRTKAKLQNIKGGANKILVISTIDIDITIKKILTEAKLCRVYDFKDFVELVLDENQKGGVLRVVKTTKFEELKVLLKYHATNNPVVVVGQPVESVYQQLIQLRQEGIESLERVELQDDEMYWDDLTPAYQDYLKEKIKGELKMTYKENDWHLVRGQLLVDCINKGMKPPVKDTVPPPLPYYVKRRLRSRSVISVSILHSKEMKLEVFAFTGVTARHELSILLKEECTDNSSNYIRRPNSNVRFIVLDNPAHFEKISGHWLHISKEKKLTWVSSNGNTRINIADYIDNEANQYHYDEEVLPSVLDGCSTRVVGIIGSDEAGKSTTLLQIANRLRDTYLDRNDRVVAVISFQDISDITAQTEEANLATIEGVITVLSFLLGTGEHGQIYIKERLSSVDKEIFLDLFINETDAMKNYDQSTIQFIQTIKEHLPTVRIWTTKFKLSLEFTTNTACFELCHLDKEDQLRLLMQYWLHGSGNKVFNGIKLRDLAEQCLERMHIPLHGMNEDIGGGGPLECKLIAETFAEEAEVLLSSESEGASTPSIHIESDSSVELFQLLVKNKLERYRKIYGENETTNEDLIDMHARVALDLYYPSYSYIISKPIDIDKILNLGFLVVVQRLGYRFINKRFAYFFIARFIVKSLRNGDAWTLDISFSKFLFEEVLRVFHINYNHFRATRKGLSNYPYFEYYVNKREFTTPLAYFLNYFLAELTVYPTEVAQQCSENLAKHIIGQLANAIYAVSHHSFVNILTFLLLMIGNTKLRSRLHKGFEVDLYILSAMHSSLEIFQKVEADIEYHSDVICMPIQALALLLAATRGQFSIIEYLLNKKGLREYLPISNQNSLLPCTEDSKKEWDDRRRLSWTPYLVIHACVSYSRYHSKAMTAEKIGIIHVLHDIDKLLLEQKDYQQRTPIMAPFIHPELRLQLMKLGGNLLGCDRKGNTILHMHLELNHWSSEEYDSLMGSIPQEDLQRLVVLTDINGDTPLGSLLQYKDPLPITVGKYKGAGADFNHRNNYGQTILQIAYNSGRTPDTFQELVKCGAKKTPFYSCSLCPSYEQYRHVHELEKVGESATFGHSKMTSDLEFHSQEDYFSLLQEIPESYRRHLMLMKNKDGDTPLSKILKSMDPTPELLDMFKDAGALFNEKSQNGDSPLFTAVAQGRSVAVLQKLIECGADINMTRGKDKTNLLHYAAHVGNQEAVEFLVKEVGFDVRKRTLTLKTAMDFAQEHQKRSGDKKVCLALERLSGQDQAGTVNGEIVEGKLLRKHERDSAANKSSNKSSWEKMYVVLKGGSMLFYKDKKRYKNVQGGAYFRGENPIYLHGALVEAAPDYTNKKHVLRLKLPTGDDYLFQSKSDDEMNLWIRSLQRASHGGMYASDPSPAQAFRSSSKEENGRRNCGCFTIKFK